MLVVNKNAAKNLAENKFFTEITADNNLKNMGLIMELMLLPLLLC